MLSDAVPRIAQARSGITPRAPTNVAGTPTTVAANQVVRVLRVSDGCVVVDPRLRTRRRTTKDVATATTIAATATPRPIRPTSSTVSGEFGSGEKVIGPIERFGAFEIAAPATNAAPESSDHTAHGKA